MSRHRSNLQRLAQNAPHRRSGSPDFDDDDVGAHEVHHGRRGGNRIDRKHGAAIGAAVLDAVEAGRLKILSVSLEEYQDVAKLRELIAAVENGTVAITKVVTCEIAEDGQPRKKSLALTLIPEGEPSFELAIVYGLA